MVATLAVLSGVWLVDPAEAVAQGYAGRMRQIMIQQAQAQQREYYGYIVRLYYRRELQDTKAEPANLNQKFPPPNTLSE